MSEYNRTQIIDTYFDKIYSGEMEFSKFRKTLEEKNIEKNEIDIIVSFIDRKLIRTAQAKAEREKGKNLFYVGLILAGFGFFLL